MRILLTTCILTLLLHSCQKQVNPDNATEPFIEQLKKQLKPVLPVYDSILFDTAFVSREGVELFVRFGFDGYPLAEKFILLRVSDNGSIVSGRIVDIQLIDHGISGKISIQSLSGDYILHDGVIADGFVERNQRNDSSSKELVLPGEGKVLPEVILISSKVMPSGMYYYWLANLMAGGSAGGGSSSAYYSSASGGNGGGGMSSNPKSPETKGGGINAPTKDGYVKDADVILVDFERAQSNPAIDIAKYVKCFDAIADAGAICSIEIFADIPVDSDPNKLFNIRSESPGHSFIQIRKSNGGKSVVQNIGFYPVKAWKSLLTPAPVDGKFVDNSLHEFNVSFKMNLSADQLKLALNEMARLSKFVKYDIDEYNCTDFALQIFNTARTNKFEIPKVNVPGAQAAAGTNTPQGIYMKLQEMKKAGHAESANITVGIVKGYVGHGNGPCQ